MTLSYQCDKCGCVFEGAPHGYPEDGDLCPKCYFEDERQSIINTCSSTVKYHKRLIEEAESKKIIDIEKLKARLGIE